MMYRKFSFEGRYVHCTLYIEPLSMCKLRGDQIVLLGPECMGGGGGMRHRLVSKHGGKGQYWGEGVATPTIGEVFVNM
jgi:hypothetical protein